MRKKEKKEKLTKTVEEAGTKKESTMEYELGYLKGQRLRGILELVAGVAVLGLGIWLFSKTWGTALLFTDAFIGRMARYYWIVLVAAAVLLAVGVLTMRKRKIPKKQETVQAGAAAESRKPVAGPTAESRKPVAGQAAESRKPEDEQTVEPQKQTGDQASVLESGKRLPAGSTLQMDEAGGESEVSAGELRKEEGDMCPQCGKMRKPDKVFCIYCGYKF